ncbi:diacylglycerol kinase family protein [Aliiglaciecola sp. LCG003]|uniref:diacylglycerol kinase family protein n=1 Tax=Aliiglaciecola sp. LCG003 TaxID=3053655 RepID=UPI002572CE76|nr:diacylglycerol kinase family protein [Aliiglaciecola sp. LCG003]WJG09645.1 diacylglycerol kinase family protein [Aliiglaciecola sp. LCG003]
MFITKYYVGGAILAFLLAYYSSHWYFFAMFAWIGLSLSFVSAAYILKTPRIFRKKQNGSIPIYIRWVFIPFLLAIDLYNAWVRKHDKVPAIQQIEDNLFLSCRLFPSDIDELQHLGVKGILDVTAEFDGLDWTAESNDLAYLNVPVLDHQSPTEEDLVNAVNWIENHRRANRGVAVHCALGRGRSVLVVAAYLLCKYPQMSVEQALEKIQGVRSTARLNNLQMRSLRKIHNNGKLSLQERAWIIANPVSGGGKWVENKQEITERLSAYLQIKVVETTEQTSARELAKQAIEQGASTLIACGGDGTLTEVASQVVGTDKTLGIIPLGTANALAHALFGTRSKIVPIEDACEHITSGNVIKIDTAQCNDKLTLLVVGLGFEQKMIESADRNQKNDSGQLAYLKGLWQAIDLNQTMTLNIEIDDQPEQELHTSSLIIANAAPFTTVLAQGGGQPDFRDGLLDLTWLPVVESTSEHIISLSELALSGLSEDFTPESVKHCTARRIRIRSTSSISYVIDGENYSDDQLEIHVNPSSLNILAPNLDPQVEQESTE